MPKCVWMFQDYVDGLCSRADVGQVQGAGAGAAPSGAGVGFLTSDGAVTRLDTTPEGIVRAAVTTLLLASQQSHDLPSAVKAASALLRYYAPPRAPQQPQEPPKDPGALPVPSWYDPEKRLSYQAEPSEPQI